MKFFKSILFSFELFFSASAFADMMCVITPAHDNPFFKAEADIAEETGIALGYDVLSLDHGDDAKVQDEHVDVCISKGAKFTKGKKWVVIYSKKYKTKKNAMKNEYKLKKNLKFKKYLKNKYAYKFKV